MNLKAQARKAQLEKSLAIWQERLAKDPSNKQAKKNIELRKQALLALSKTVEVAAKVIEKRVATSIEVPKITNANDLYKFASSLGVEYKRSNGKPKGTDEIKSLIAKVLWDKEFPGVKMPPQIAPMLINDITAKGKDYIDRTFKDGDYILQQKINGQRFILVIEPNGTTHMTSRDRSVKTFRYSELDDHVLGLLNIKSPFKHGNTILDGEIIYPDSNIKLPSGVMTTSTLQSTVALMHMNSKDSLEFQRKHKSLRYKVFDIIEIDGINVEDEEYDVRKVLTIKACKELIKFNPSISIDILPTIEKFESAWDEFQNYVSKGGEGLILKNRHAKYEQGKRTKGQYKLKGFIGVDCFVTGYVPSSENKQFKDLIGGLVFSTNYKGKKIEVAAISNIDMATRKAATVLDEQGKPTLNPTWLGKVAEIKAQNFKKGSLRMGSARINEWRDDKLPSDCELTDDMIVYDS